jgi:predicted transcriptional regulator with HTH domain
MYDITITSGAQYAKLITDALKEVEMELPLNERMDERLFQLWCEEVTYMAKESFVQYIIGKKEDYHLTDVEMDYCLEVAGLEYTQQILDGMVKKGMVDTIEEDGEKIYKISENGKIYLQTINN